MGIDVSFDTSQLVNLERQLAVAEAKATPMAVEAVDHTTDDVLATAQQLAPVLTGELRASGHAVKSGLTAEVVFDSGHASYVEYGTNDTAPQPYINPALDMHQDGFIQTLERGALGLL